MIQKSDIVEHMEIIGADGVHVGTVDHMADDGTDRIKLTKHDSPQTEDEKGASHHYLPFGLAASVENGKLRLSATGAAAHDLFEEAD